MSENIIKTEYSEVMQKSYIDYAMSVIIARALPDVRDGLKPVQRRTLYDMHELGIYYNRPYRKSARIVGDTMGKYHPHGDSSIYESLVVMAQDFKKGLALVDGHGNFGNIEGDTPAAMRYTEARLQKVTQDAMLSDLDKDVIDFIPNFDETEKEPEVLPCRIPNILINGSEGIAVGMTTSIPPHNLGEVIDAMKAYIENPEISTKQLMRYIKGPDFPTGGLIMGRSGIREAYYTGHGRITVRAKTSIEDMGSGRSRIIVTEIPYQVNKSVLVKKIADLVHEKKVEGISDIRDESNDRQGMRIVIELKKDVQPQVVLNMLYKHSSLQENFGANMLALVNGKPRVLNLREMIYYYLEHQKEVVTRRTRFELDKANARAHILEGLLKALDHIDEIVAIIRASKDTATAKEALMLRFEFSDKQAQAILDMRLGRLTGLEREKLQEEYEELEKTIARLTAILADEHLLMDVIKTEISEIRDKYGDDRRSELTIAEDDIDIEDLIQEENMVVTMTHEGYVKRVSSSVYRAQHRGGRGVSGMNVKETDYTTQMFVTSTHQEIMFFSNLGRVYSLKCYQIPEAGRQARGTAIINLLQIAGGEKISTMLPMPREAEHEYNLVMATRNGMIKKTSLGEFRNLRKNGLIAIALREEDELIGVRLSTGSDEMLVSTRKGKCIRFNEQHVRAVGRNSIGVRSMRLAPGDEVIDIAAVEPGTTVLAVTALGYGKRTDPEEYREQGRGGMGIKAMQLTEKTGDLVALLFAHEDEDILMITDDGTIIRTRAADIRLCGRATQGVRLMRLAEGSSVVGVCRAEKEEEEETEAPETAPEAEEGTAAESADEGAPDQKE